MRIVGGSGYKPMTEKIAVQNANVAVEEMGECGNLHGIEKLDKGESGNRNYYRAEYDYTGFNHQGHSREYSFQVNAFWEHDGKLIVTGRLWASYKDDHVERQVG